MEEKLICIQCGGAFELSEIEMGMYERAGFTSFPRRCPDCRGAVKALESAVRPPKEMYSAICDGCGLQTQIPFKPKGDKPVYCRECFAKNKKQEKI